MYLYELWSSQSDSIPIHQVKFNKVQATVTIISLKIAFASSSNYIRWLKYYAQADELYQFIQEKQKEINALEETI